MIRSGRYDGYLMAQAGRALTSLSPEQLSECLRQACTSQEDVQSISSFGASGSPLKELIEDARLRGLDDLVSVYQARLRAYKAAQ